MSSLRDRYLELLRHHDLEEPPARLSTARTIERIKENLDSANEINKNISEQCWNSIFELDTEGRILVDEEFLGLQDDTAISKYLGAIKNAYEKRGVIIDDSLYFNEFPTGSFNAEISPVDNGYLCLINRGLLRLLYGLSFSALYPVKGKIDGTPFDTKVILQTNIDKNNKRVPESILAAIVRSYNYIRNCDTDPVYSYKEKIDPASMLISNSLCIGMKSFVICHEISHFSLGHLNKSKTIKKIVNNDTIEVLEVSHDMEFDADIDALETLIVMSEEEQELPTPYFAGAVCFFYVQLIIEIVNNKLHSSESCEESTHPSTVERIKRLRAYLEKRFSSDVYSNFLELEFIFYHMVTSINESKLTMTEEGLEIELPEAMRSSSA